MTNKTPEPIVQIPVRAPESFRKRLKTASRLSDSTMNEYMLKALEAAVAKTLKEGK